MGKKSKKKGGGAANKAARKEKLQERREQQLEQLDQYSDDSGNNEIVQRRRHREYFVGDRVWFRRQDWPCDINNPNTYRGIVRAVDEDKMLTIAPLQGFIDGDGHQIQIHSKANSEDHFVCPDFWDMTLRFDIGDKVICRTNNWEPAIVAALWPIFHIAEFDRPMSARDDVPQYKCDAILESGFITPPNDGDDFVQKRPSSFRFNVGDNVTFNSYNAWGNTGAAANHLRRQKDEWTNGKIVSVDICKANLSYAVYECSFKVAGKKYSCLINDDDDEHIALVDVDPRKRLFDAIEQDCSRYHFIYLKSHFNIDVAAFRDLVMAKAIEFASYNALTWLQHDCNIDVRFVKDKDGNNFFHLIANSPFASRFIRRWGENGFFRDDRDDVTLEIFAFSNLRPETLNNNGEVWLQYLVRRGDVKALDTVFSPHFGLAWEAYIFRGDVLELVASSIKESNNPTMQCIFDTFVPFQKIYQQLDCLAYSTHDSEEALLQDDRMSIFQGDDAKHGAKLLTRFYRDWKDRLSQNLLFRNIFKQLVEKGMFQLFQLFFEADQGLFEMNGYSAHRNEDRQQFIQEELRTSAENYDQSEDGTINIFDACVLGNHSPDHYRHNFCDINFTNYVWLIRYHFLTCEADSCPSLHHHLSEAAKVTYSDIKCVEYRLKLLEDEDDVEGRRKILDCLLLKHEHFRLDALFILQNRQCWALRFMVDKMHLDLEGLAAKEEKLAQNAPKLSFLNSGHIPSNMTVRCFLSFAAVQYDDLQSLEWLNESMGAPNYLVGGWNLLHYSAFMGRIEIIGWLSTQSVWSSLVSQASTRKPFVGAYAVHIAARNGHLHVCDLLIALKVPLEDKKGKLPDDYTEKSKYEFVRKWAADNRKPQSLKKEVEKLLRQVEERKSAKQIKDFIISSGCLDIENWLACDVRSFDKKLLGISFRDALHALCKNSDVDLARWICFRLYFSCRTRSREENFWGQGCIPRGQKLIARDDLLSIARERRYDDLVGHLQGKWFKEISCIDPLTQNPILESALGGDERLVDVRAAVLRIDALVYVVKSSIDEIEDIVLKGGRVKELGELLSITAAARKAVMAETDDIFSGTNRMSRYLHQTLRPFKMNQRLWQHGTTGRSVAFPMLFEGEMEDQAHIILAKEGYTDLLHFCLSNIQGWTAAMELNVVRVASFFGHASIVDMVLNPNGAFELHSDEKERHNAAILGAGQALRYRDLEILMTIPTSITGKGEVKRIEGDSLKHFFEEEERMMEESLIVVVLSGYTRETFDSDMDNKIALKTLRFLVDRHIYTHDDILYAIKILFERDNVFGIRLVCLLDLLQSIVDAFRIQLISHSKKMQEICELLVSFSFSRHDGPGFSKVNQSNTRFFSTVATAGIDIQQLNRDRIYSKSSLGEFLTNLQQKQLDDWSRFDIVKKGGSLADIQQVMKDEDLTVHSRDRGGLLLTHLSAAYDRVDLLEWLVVNEGMDLNTRDAHHRTALDVAKASKASLATKWIVEWKAKATISSFVRRNHYHAMHRRRIQQSTNAAIIIQSVMRAYATRKLFANVIMQRMEESQRFSTLWDRVIAVVDNAATATATSWADIRERLIDIKVGLDDEMLDDTDQKLSVAMEEAVLDESDGEDYDFVPDDATDLKKLVPHDGGTEELNSSSNQWLSFQMTSHVVKFLQQGDKKYRSFFVRRMRQLASGERSRILQKPLKGSKTHIFETYLEQKSGHRILWTEERGSIIIWYIAKHKQVSRLMQLIDDSKSRSARQQMPATLVGELQHEGLLERNAPKKEVLIDIFGNVPLKIYDVNFNTINEITRDSWTPRLHLTDEERDIVEADGTVLVLGRSGTGKTICISSSIEFDRQSVAAKDPSFTQLFVARSTRLCRYVEGAVGEDNRSSFLTYGRLLNDIESILGQTLNFNPSQKIDFGRFKRDFHNRSSSNEKISALISWTVIRTFLKGSIEAFQSPDGILPRNEFVEVERLGKNRCRIPAELREQVYDEFLQYQKYLEDQQLWDDCDRVRHLLFRIKQSKKEDPDAFEQVQRSKVYVDEVQDYTQLEILLFFYLSGPNGLFLAGDPAQSVVEGTEFRFEEVRGVGHFVGSVIQKPKTVNVNFRSHSGILNCAGGVLDLMFTHFPSSAKQLKKDEGLFQGSRPEILLGTSIDKLNILLGDKLKGAVVLTHDESARHWRRLLNDYKVSYS